MAADNQELSVEDGNLLETGVMSLACWGNVIILRRGIFEVGLYVYLHVLE